MSFLFGVLPADCRSESQEPEALKTVIEFSKAEFFRGAFAGPGDLPEEGEEIVVPASWQSLGLGGVGDEGWYRFRVVVPLGWRGRELAVSPAYPGSIGEVFWNGKKTGSKGDMGRLLGVEWQGRYEVYPLKENILWGEENEIVVRVYCAFSEGGIVGAAPAVGELSALKLRQIEKSQTPAIFLIGQLFLYAFCGIVAVGLLCAAPRNEAHWYFFGFYIGEVFLRFFSGGMLLEIISFSFPVWQLAVTLYWGLYIGAVLLFAQQVFRGATTGKARVMMGANLLAAIGMVAFYKNGETNVAVLFFATAVVLLNVWMISWVGSLIWSAVQTKERMSRTAYVVWLFVLLGFVPDTLNYFFAFQSEVNNWTPLSSWTGLVLVGFYAYFLIDRLAGIKVRARRLASHVFSARNEERARIARELHDGIAADVNSLRRRVENAGLKKAEVATQLERVGDDIRSLAHGLHPAVLSDATLRDACASVADELSTPEFSVKLDFEVDSVGAERDVELYRIFQECAGNAMKHGNASVFEVKLRSADSGFQFALSDDGSRAEAAGRLSGGMGMLSIQERVARMDGRFESFCDRGMRIVISIPEAPA